jgi:hypothetical protein
LSFFLALGWPMPTRVLAKLDPAKPEF